MKRQIGRDPEKLRENNRRWYARHRDRIRAAYVRIDPAVKKLRIAERWAPGGKFYERAKKRALSRDLAMLGRVIEMFRKRLLKVPILAQQNREKSLRAWNARGVFKRRRQVIHSAFIRAIRRQAKRQRADQTSLVRAIRRIEGRPLVILRKHLRRRYDKAIARLKVAGSKTYVAQKLLGCSLPELRRHLEKKFQPGMAWNNHGFRGWHIDHIRPLAKFNLRDPAQQQAAFHFTNLQPLWAKENLEKSDS